MGHPSAEVVPIIGVGVRSHLTNNVCFVRSHCVIEFGNRSYTVLQFVAVCVFVVLQFAALRNNA